MYFVSYFIAVATALRIDLTVQETELAHPVVGATREVINFVNY